MDRGFLGRRTGVVGPDVVGEVVRAGVFGVDGSEHQATGAQIAHLSVDRVSVGVGAVSNAVAAIGVTDVGLLPGQPMTKVLSPGLFGRRGAQSSTPCGRSGGR